jgi:hypothetical protein
VHATNIDGLHPEVVDVDGDTSPDVCLAAGLAGVVVFRGAGTGVLFDAPRLNASSPQFIDSDDFNGDGLSDLAACNPASDSITVWLGIGDAAFSEGIHHAVGDFPASFATGDLDQDGKVDIAIACSSSEAIGFLYGRGDGTFEEQTLFGFGARPVRIALDDLDADGWLDLLVGSTERDLSVFLNAGQRTFMPETNYAVPGQAFIPATGDLNDDGLRDVVVGRSEVPYGVVVFLGLGDGTLSPFAAYTPPASGPTFAVTVGDATSDGYEDVVITQAASDRVCVLPGVGDGTLGDGSCYATFDSPRAARIADVDDDAVADLVVSTGISNSVLIFLGSGNGGLDLATPAYGCGLAANDLVVEDLNDDGIEDVAVANSASDTIALLFGQPSAVGVPGVATAAIEIVSAKPNPTSGGSQFRFNVPSPGRLVVRVYDVAGRLVSTVLDHNVPEGLSEWRWDAGAAVAPGVYLMHVRHPSGVSTRKISVAK